MDKHSTSMDNGTDTMNKTSSLQRNVAVQARIINKLLDRSQIYMDSAFRLIHQSSAHICIVLGYRALESMLMALYIKENNLTSLPHSLSLEDLARLTDDKTGPDLDTVMFIQSIHFLASFKDTALLQQIQITHLKRVLSRVDDVLNHLSRRISTYSSEEDRSIFSK
ncbi:hypothetical protein [Paenibacillus sp. PSB04]|uniref:hypothetical protein n=1 Tax=Paenibacillus sp. PSB04 TaxID=2866810 RepID=UPI0021F0D13F|nr:hypothetical protein [Paenibacillus sp. PSB04]UYO06441.1 hypothetical protein K2F33_11465 [Paenibacillus sp. PSB04]